MRESLMNRKIASKIADMLTTGKTALIAVLMLFLATGCAGNSIIKVDNKTEVKLPELLDTIKAKNVVFVGELHNEKWNHNVQLNVIKALHDSGLPVAIGLEMFQVDSQEALDKWVSGNISLDEFRKIYHKNWQFPWKQYSDIFYYARDNRIPIVALNVPRKLIHQVFMGGFKSLTPEQLAMLPGVKCDVDKTYEDFIKRAMEEHASKEGSFKNFCEAQMVWDTAMARNSIEYIHKNPETKLIVLAGSGHSWKRGIPNQMKRQNAALSTVVILPESRKRIRAGDITPDDADYIWTRPIKTYFVDE